MSIYEICEIIYFDLCENRLSCVKNARKGFLIKNEKNEYFNEMLLTTKFPGKC